MSQNRSSAVMQQCHDPHESLNYFPTPPWATRALCELLTEMGLVTAEQSVWEPACGEGHMARPLAEYFASVRASDVHGYGFGEVQDFLWPDSAGASDWIITNPPFRLAEQFAVTAIERARVGAALLVRSAFLEGQSRYERLFRPYQPMLIAQFCERVAMVKGRYDPKASTATAYCWIVWPGAGNRQAEETRMVWIPPCRASLERPCDTEAAS